MLVYVLLCYLDRESFATPRESVPLGMGRMAQTLGLAFSSHCKDLQRALVSGTARCSRGSAISSQPYLLSKLGIQNR